MTSNYPRASLYAAAVVGSAWALAAGRPAAAVVGFLFAFVVTLVGALLLSPLFWLARRFLPAGAYLLAHVLVPSALWLAWLDNGKHDVFFVVLNLSVTAASLAGWLAVENLAAGSAIGGRRRSPVPLPDRRANLAAGFILLAVSVAALMPS